MSTPSAETAWTFLQLCQRTAQEAGITNATLALAPTATTNQQGELLRVVNKVSDAWREIQGRRHWSWMWENPTITVPAGTNVLATGIPAERWVKTATFNPGPVGSDNAGGFLDYVTWERFRLLYPRILAGSTIGVWSVDPQGNFRVNGLAPTGDLVLTVERYANPTRLAADADVPGLPADLQMLIVYKAVRKLAGDDEAGAMRQIALDEEKDLMNDLVARCLPEITLGGTILDETDIY